MPRSNESFLLSGWLFADLLLALAVLFLAANTAGIKPIPPTLTVSPTALDINSHTPNCTLQASNSPDTNVAQCNVTLEEPKGSSGDIHWSIGSDISNTIQYTIGAQAVTGGRLSPGQQKVLTISAIPCQNGSFTFNTMPIGENISEVPLVVLFKCTPLKERLDPIYKTFYLNVNDVNALRSNDTAQINDIKQQIARTTLLSNKKVGLAIVYDGAPTPADISTAQDVAGKIYNILNSFQNNDASPFSRSSPYVNLYNLGHSQHEVQVDVYFFKESPSP